MPTWTSLPAMLCLMASTLSAAPADTEGAAAPDAERTVLEEGVAALSRGEIAEAERAMRRLVQVYASSANTLSADERSRYVFALSLVATAQQVQGRIEDAEAFLRCAVAASEPASSESAQSLTALAGVLMDRGRVDEAETLVRRAHDIWRGRGELGPEAVPTLNTLAEVAVVRNDVAGAERWLDEAERIAARPGVSIVVRAAVAARRGALWLALGRYREAEPWLEQGLRLGEEAVGSNHPSTLLILRTLADCYRARERHAAAAPLYERFLAVGAAAYGPAHPLLLPGLVGLADTAERMGEVSRAEALFARAAAIVLEKLDTRDPDRAAYLALVDGFLARHGRTRAGSRYVAAAPAPPREAASEKKNVAP
jgi:tetratricopeptide (TPR) repeat protein